MEKGSFKSKLFAKILNALNMALLYNERNNVHPQLSLSQLFFNAFIVTYISQTILLKVCDAQVTLKTLGLCIICCYRVSHRAGPQHYCCHAVSTSLNTFMAKSSVINHKRRMMSAFNGTCFQGEAFLIRSNCRSV